MTHKEKHPFGACRDERDPDLCGHCGCIAFNRRYGHSDECKFGTENSGLCSCGVGFKDAPNRGYHGVTVCDVHHEKLGAKELAVLLKYLTDRLFPEETDHET